MKAIEEIREFLLREIVADQGRETIEIDEDLISEGIVDSLGILKLISFIEETFGIAIDNEDIVPENFQTLRLLTNFIERKQGRR